MGTLSLKKEEYTMENTVRIYNARIYNGEKTLSSISRARKTGQLHLKNETRTTPNTIHKNKLKMD